MAAITNIEVYNLQGVSLLVTFGNGGQDQGGTITIDPRNNVVNGDPNKLQEDGKYQLTYTSVGHQYPGNKRKLEIEADGSVYAFRVY